MTALSRDQHTRLWARLPLLAARMEQHTIYQYFQDELVSCAPHVQTCRQTSPDAVIHKNDYVSLRAERTSTNGRVYQVTFVADNGAGGTCIGHVNVCVPGTRGATCVDDGQHDDSTQP